MALKPLEIRPAAPGLISLSFTQSLELWQTRAPGYPPDLSSFQDLSDLSCCRRKSQPARTANTPVTHGRSDWDKPGCWEANHQAEFLLKDYSGH